VRTVNGAKLPSRQGSVWLLGAKGWVATKRSHLTAPRSGVPIPLINGEKKLKFGITARIWGRGETPGRHPASGWEPAGVGARPRRRCDSPALLGFKARCQNGFFLFSPHIFVLFFLLPVRWEGNPSPPIYFPVWLSPKLPDDARRAKSGRGGNHSANPPRHEEPPRERRFAGSPASQRAP